MCCESMSREHTLGHVARKVRNEMVETLNCDLGGKLSVERTNEMKGLKKRLGAFRPSSRWVRKFLRRKTLCSRVGAGTVECFPRKQ